LGQEKTWISFKLVFDSIYHQAERLVVLLVNALEDMLLANKEDEGHVKHKLHYDTQMANNNDWKAIQVWIGTKHA
jgi:hypothetical protein